MPQAKYPFNDNTREYHAPMPVRGLRTPGQLPGQLPLTPLGSANRPPRQYTKKSPSNFGFALDATFSRTIIACPGTIFWVSSSDQTANVRIQFDDDAGIPTTTNFAGIVVRNGFRWAGGPFYQMRVSNVSAQAGLTIEIAVCTDTPDDRLDVDL